MDRLTKRTKCGMAYIVIPLNTSHIGFQCFTGFIADRLADYEDTGLTPQEIDELQELNKHLLEKLEEYEWEYGSVDTAMFYAELQGRSKVNAK